MFLFLFLFEFTFNLKKVSVGRRFTYEQNIDGHINDVSRKLASIFTYLSRKIFAFEVSDG